MTRRVGIWSETVEFQTYMIAKAATLRGYSVDVITQPKNASKHHGHLFYYEKLEKLECVRVLQEAAATALDWLYIQISAEPAIKQLLHLSQYAKHIAIFSACGKLSYGKTLRSQIREVVKYFPISLRAERVFLPDGLYPFDLYGAWAKRYHIGIDVHSNFLDDSSLSAKLFAADWSPNAIRKYRFNFIGNRNPQPRTQIVQTIKSYLSSQHYSRQDSDEYLWIEYGDDPGEVRGVAPVEYIGYLSESDFTLCPPGYFRATHRVVEALVRGSIPVLHADELELYDLDLQNQVNCLTVDHKNWIQTVERLINMPHQEIVQIRSNILAMRAQHLTAASYSKKLSAKMGLANEPQS